ncbi:Serine/threonine-protein kinase ULK4 [Chelonia mydas]|uniref:Serine/threonine-protein kinase ULK4 n=1 Tax=Chelonia mydas TaxID=8469 RepID=M7B7S8_CHEMY|nr:Serine/threonine-protein kinase ULK4 [Chelonia mydas]
MGSNRSSGGQFIVSSIDTINGLPIALASTSVLHLNEMCKRNRRESISRQDTAITSNKKHSESLKNDGDSLIQILERLAQTASSHADIAVAALAFEILRTVGR